MNVLAYDPWKRLIDLVVAGVAVVATAPLQLMIAGLVRTRLGSPVLFRQERPGRHERPFTLVKFRTMLPIDERAGRVTDDQRMTRLGSFLRSTSLDELPTLWNVIRGDMSLVGPRPLLVRYLPLYSAEQRRRHDVRPGITGLAQVSGRNSLTWEAKFRLDLDYVERRSFWLDLRLVAATAWRVLRRKGVNAPGQVTMPEFLGGVTAATNRRSAENK